MSELADINQRYENLSARRALTHSVIARGVAPIGEWADELTQRLGQRSSHLERLTKGAVGALATSDQGFDVLQPLRTAWADLVRRQTLIGRMGGAVRNVPAAVSVTVVDSGTSATFIAEGGPIPVQKPTLTDASQVPGKIALIVPYTQELHRRSSELGAVLVERDGSRALSLGEDGALTDGAAAVAGGRPASILNGLTPLVGTGGDDVEADVLALLAAVRSGNAVAPYFLTSPAGAIVLMGLRHSDGGRIFPDVTIAGGSLYGAPLLVSAGAPATTLALVDADALLVTDGGVDIQVSRASAFQFDSAPSAGAQANVSLFQTNSFAVRFERWIAWRLAWTDGAAHMILPSGSPA